MASWAPPTGTVSYMPEMILLTRTWTSAGSGNTLKPPGGASGGTVVLTSQPRPQAKVDQCR